MGDNEQILEIMTKLYDEMKEIKSEVNYIQMTLDNEVKTDIKNIQTEVKDIQMTLDNEVIIDIKDLKTEVKDIQMTLENETNKNIRLIAEGHLNLDRKLDNALKVESEKELLLVRVTSLENEVRRIKTRIEKIS